VAPQQAGLTELLLLNEFSRGGSPHYLETSRAPPFGAQSFTFPAGSSREIRALGERAVKALIGQGEVL